MTRAEKPDPLNAVRMPGAKSIRTIALWGYLLTLGGLTLVSSVSRTRLWGMSYWRYYPDITRVLLFVICAVVGLFLYRRVTSPQRQPGRGNKRAAASTSLSAGQIALLVAVHGLVYFLLRAQTHFLGDGYLQLNQLAQGTPVYRIHSLGETLLHFAIKNLLPLPKDAAALTTYQWLSILAGTSFVAVMAWSGRHLFPVRSQQWLWTLAMAAGGYSLLFFGYVENYSLFCLSVGLFVTVGLLAANSKISVWWIVPLLMISVFLHGNGLSLCPAAAYLILTRTGVDQWVRSWRPVAKWVAAGALLVCLGSLAYWIDENSRFVRYALVPWQSGPRTIEGYTLFSVAHIADFVSLMFLLIPGLLLLTVFAVRNRTHPETIAACRARGFLGICVLSTCAVTFLLEAKLGMPRDWDLFSFVGIPTLAYLMLPPIEMARKSRPVRGMLVLVITLGYLGLISRATVLAVPDLGMEQFRSFAQLDMQKNRAGWFTLGQYLKREGDRIGLNEIARLRMEQYPEEQMAVRSGQLLAQGELSEAAELAQQAIQRNPMYAAPWLSLGMTLAARHMWDSALEILEIADVLGPHSRFVLKELGTVYYQSGRRDDAERCWLESHHLDPHEHHTTVSLARLYQANHDSDRYEELLMEAAYQPEADGQLALELANLKLEAGDFRAAVGAYKHALAKGLDWALLEDVIQSHPELRDQLTPPPQP